MRLLEEISLILSNRETAKVFHPDDVSKVVLRDLATGEAFTLKKKERLTGQVQVSAFYATLRSNYSDS